MTELADIFRHSGSSYLAKYQDRLPPSHKKAFRDILNCRTEHLGGQVYCCKHCGKVHYSYHSCKNRHCPKCMNDSAEEWLIKQKDRLLPVLYFMATFTLPDDLRRLARSNQKIIYNLLFKASSEALQKLAADPKYVGGKLGLCGILHTWTRKLNFHPHVHYLIPGGGLNGTQWKTVKNDYLMPVKALSKIFRAKFRVNLRKTDLYDQVPAAIWNNKWVVHIEPVGSGLPAYKYLAPYVFRVAIANNNILSLKEERVTFRYRSQLKQWKHETLSAEEFIRRFLQHVLPRRFRKVRYYGFLAARNKNQLQLIQYLFGRRYLPVKTATTDQSVPKLRSCPKCGQALILLKILPCKRGPPLGLPDYSA